jgi:hypothetical protein
MDSKFKEIESTCAGSKVAHPLRMTSRSLLMAAAVVLSAALIHPADSAAQRQRSPGGNGNGGGRQESGGGGGQRQRENGGGGGARQRDGGGSRQREDGGSARRQDGGGRAEVRAAQPRGESGDRGDRGSRTRGDSGRREASSEVREATPPPQAQSAPPAATNSEGGAQDVRTARRRFPTDEDRNRNTVTRENGAVRTDIDRNRGDRGDRGRVVRGDNNVRSGSRVAVPRAGRPPQRWNDRDRNVYGSYYGGRSVYGRYAYRGSRNIYIVPRGRTYYYYPRYYYNPYSYGYGPAGRGHFYFDLHYNSYIWHPYGIARYGNYGTYGYPVGELRLKVHPRDAQVFIDGYYAGRVDEFDGVFQSLRLEEGEYEVEIVLPGYEPLAFDVRILPGEKTTYEGDLIPE